MGWSEKYKKSINCDNPKGFSQRAHCQGRKKKMNEGKEKQDHEVSMAKTQVKKSIDNLQKVARVLAKKTDADNLPAWVQAKITDTEHNTSAAADYMGEEKKKCGEGQYWCKTDEKCKKIPKGYHTMPNGDLMKDSEHEDGGDMSEEYLAEKKKGGTLHKWFKGSKSKDGKPGWVNVVTGGTCASDEPGEGTPKCVSSSKRASMTKAERKSAARRKKKADPGQQQKTGAAKPTYVSTDPKKKKKVKEEFEVTEARDVKGKGSGKKDACYHKVKSRYSVWPSAYASGALVKCRKVGAANWGNSTKNESFQYSNWRDDFKALEIETIDLIKPEPLVNEGLVKTALIGAGIYGASQLIGRGMKNFVDTHTKTKPEDYSNPQGLGAKFAEKRRQLQKQSFEPQGEVIDEAGKKCWKGYEKKGTQKLFGKTYNRCVKKEGFSNWREELQLIEYADGGGQIGRGSVMAGPKSAEFVEKLPGRVRGVARRLKKIVKPGFSIKGNEIQINSYEPEGEIIEGAAWTKKSGKNPKGGLNEKGRKSYERENPGSDLKRPSKKKGNKRRKSFCARMKGMKKKLTSKKTARDPNSRINKSLRAWNC